MIFYFLASNPSVRRKACDELDTVFGPSLSGTAQKIRDDPYVLNNLPYNNAVMKEALLSLPTRQHRARWLPIRLHHRPGNRRALPHPRLGRLARIRTSSAATRSTSHCRSSSCPSAGFQNSAPSQCLRPVAFRAFERGPRNCIGGEFGTLEIKVVLALTLRDYVFVPGYEKGAPTVDGEPCYQMLFGSAKPKGSVPGTVVKATSQT